MATKTKKPKKGRGRRQKLLPGHEPVYVTALDHAAANYFEVMQERVRLSKEEDEKKTALIELMKENGMTRYESADGLIVTVSDKSNVKCKKVKDASDNGDGESEASDE